METTTFEPGVLIPSVHDHLVVERCFFEIVVNADVDLVNVRRLEAARYQRGLTLPAVGKSKCADRARDQGVPVVGASF